jgi:ABC-type glycerol-3-phosphate transport system permease component
VNAPASARAHGAVKRPRRYRRLGEWLLVQVSLLAVIALFGAPFLWIAAAAFDAEDGVRPWPGSPTLANVRLLFREKETAPALANSLAVAGATMALTALAAGLAGYSLSRLRIRGTETAAAAVLLLQALPLAATMIPIYDLARRLDLRNTYVGLVLVHTALALPFLVWLMKDVFDAVPRDLEEAAWVDGAAPLRAWVGVLLPNVAAGLGVAAGYAFLIAWSEVVLVLVLADPAELPTIALAFYLSRGVDEFPVTAALALLYLLPVLAVFAVAGRLIVRGIATSVSGA